MRFYFGWWIVGIAVLLETVAIGLSVGAFGLFVLPVSREFHLTRAEANSGAILINFGMAIVSPLVGRLLDRRSIRLIIALSALSFGIGVTVLGISHDIRLNAFLLAVPVAIGTVGAGTVTPPTLVARWFDHLRGRAMSVAIIGFSIGPIVAAPIVSFLIRGFGWRGSLLIVGPAAGAIMLLLSLFVRNRPGPGDIEPQPAGAMEANTPTAIGVAREPLSIARLIRLPQFWSLALGVALAFGVLQTAIVSLVPFGESQGLSMTQAASLVSAYGSAAIVGVLLVAWLGDRFDRGALLAVVTGLFALTAGSPLVLHGYAGLLVASALTGVTGAAITPVYLALLADLFGAESFGTSNGTASLISTMVSALCIWIGGETFDRTGSYIPMFLFFIALGVMAVIMIVITTPLSRRYGRE